MSSTSRGLTGFRNLWAIIAHCLAFQAAGVVFCGHFHVFCPSQGCLCVAEFFGQGYLLFCWPTGTKWVLLALQILWQCWKRDGFCMPITVLLLHNAIGMVEDTRLLSTGCQTELEGPVMMNYFSHDFQPFTLPKPQHACRCIYSSLILLFLFVRFIPKIGITFLW